MLHIAYRKIGQSKGNARIWLEGRQLSDNGFTSGKAISVKYSPSRQEIKITGSEFGNRLVSSRKRQGERCPILDISNKAVTEILAGATRIKVAFSQGNITVTIHPDEQAVSERTLRLKRAVRSRHLTLGSIAHGGGILDHAIHTGLNDQGLSSTLGFGIEIEQKYLETSLRNNPVWGESSLAILAGMEEVDLGSIPKVDILNAGIPCTGASIAGRSKNKLKSAEEHSTAGALFLAFLNIVKACNPSIILLENVPQYSTTTSMTVIRNVLDTWGYDVHEAKLNGVQMGALENRDRLCMVAVTKGIKFDFAGLIPVETKEMNLGEVMDDVEEDSPLWREFGYLKEKEVRDKKNGKGFAMQIYTALSESVATLAKGYSKIRGTEPKIQHPTRPHLLRQLTVSEHARVKKIPTYLIAGCSNTTAHEIMGQSVIFPAFRAVGRLLSDTIFKHTEVTA